ncbi:hypothetical protein D1864_08370 [Oceanobacillus picturae]|nr:hypothetical protein D1864_08370 [Oceanobacillus picturae]
MRLPSGVTGFYSLKLEPPPQVDGKQFKQLCFQFASQNRASIMEFHMPKHPTNFYYALVEMLNNRFYILLNEHYPYLAFSSAVDFGNIKFIDRHDLNNRFSSYYRILSKRELSTPFNQKNLNKSELNRAELDQITFWEPQTVGQVIFNYWD